MMQKSNTQNSSPNRPVIMLELNELCPPILDRMMAAGDLPHFKELHQRSDVHVTWTDDEDLEPWVQWVTLHTGKTQTTHRAKELDEGHLVQLPRVWDFLGDQGIDSLVFGSMNGGAVSNKVFLVPDPWSVRVQPTDASYSIFHRFISFFVTEHTNEKAKPTGKMTLGFALFMLTHGLKPATCITAVKQLFTEKTKGCEQKWGRALILDLLMWDVFAHAYKRQKPQFATYFANSTAFLQHRYWRHMQPEAFSVKPSHAEMQSYGHAIEHSYQHMDAIVGRAVQLAKTTGARIVFATALSQEANLRYEDIGGKFVYRPHDFIALNTLAGGPANVTFEPVMTHQTWASFATVAEAIAFENTLQSLQHNGQTIMEWRRAEARVMFWCRFISVVDEGMLITATQTAKTVPFATLFALVGQVNNSQHNRNGAFWLERDDARSHVHAQKLPLESVTEKLLALFGKTAVSGI